ncbi:GerAB/ArcD/ProY family transporter [Sporomusa aerivorans]|uniref:GerAB/ArcD/ProY family transporter n=1 Tax=Sporomusa aerivorans TaxID=204936 RepID=UPI00352BA885
MSYRPGQAGLAEGVAFAFIATVPRIFLTTPAITTGQSGELSWAVPLINGVCSMIMFFLILYVAERVPGDLLAVCRQLLGNPFAWLTGLFYIALFWGNSILLLRQYTENTLVTALPYVDFHIVIAWYSFVIGFFIFTGHSTIIRVSYLVLPWLLASILAVFALLASKYNVYNLIPWQGNGLINGLKLGIMVAGYDISVFALIIMAPSFQNHRTVRAAGIYGLSLSVMLKTLITLVYLLVFGTEVGMEKTLPFFEMSRLIYISRFVQHVEALLIALWVVTGLLAITANLYVVVYLMSRLLNLPAIRPIAPLITVITACLAMLPKNFDDVVVLDGSFNLVSGAGLYFIPVILTLTTLLKLRKKQCG